MENISERSELRSLQKEQERERRRLRDRQRRQSMTLEQRERHLARRRRNYQLRRQKAAASQLDSPCVQLLMPSGDGDVMSNDHQGGTSFPDYSVRSNGFGHAGSGKELHEECRSTACLEIPAHTLSGVQGKLRLNRIRHLARTLKNPVNGVAGDKQQLADFVRKGDEIGTSSCGSLKGLRLNHIKRIARENVSMKGISGLDHQSTLNELKLSQGEVQEKPADGRVSEDVILDSNEDQFVQMNN